MQTKYQIKGMTCNHCVAHVTEEVKAVPQVQNVEVSLAEELMVITSETPIPMEQVLAAVAEAGDYQVSAL